MAIFFPFLGGGGDTYPEEGRGPGYSASKFHQFIGRFVLENSWLDSHLQEGRSKVVQIDAEQGDFVAASPKYYYDNKYTFLF